MTTLRLALRSISIPQRLLLASALAYAGVFALLLAFGRPGLGISQGFYVAVILAAAATSAPAGALAGAGALVLYELGIRHGGLAWSDFTYAGALTSLGGYVAAGVVVGFMARRGRRMLAQSFFVLEDLLEIATERLDEPEHVSREQASSG